MPYSVPLSRDLQGQGWKVKIRDRERLEPPHVTILRETRAWRIDLRSRSFMDDSPDPAEVPPALLAQIRASWDTICTEWDAMYPTNPVSGGHDDQD